MAASKRRNRKNPNRIPTTLTTQRESVAWDLYSRGKRQSEIAAELGVSQQAVSQALRRVEVRVLAELKERVEQQKTRQAARLEHVYFEALAAWERSKLDAKKYVEKTGGQHGSESSEITEPQCGDPRLLDQARGALADLRKIWGLDSPVKNAMTDKGGNDVPQGAGVMFYLPSNGREDAKAG